LIEGEADHIGVQCLAPMPPSYGIDQSGIRRPPIQRKRIMPYVVTEACINCKHTDCVEVCPVDCFYEGPNFLVIHPDECIDCNACVPVCPVEAIYADDELPEELAHYAEWNTYLANQWQTLGYNITEKKDPLPDAEEWANKEKTEQDILTWEADA